MHCYAEGKNMTPLYILLEVHPCKPAPQDVTDMIADRVWRMDWVDKSNPKDKRLTATILSEEQVSKIERSEA